MGSNTSQHRDWTVGDTCIKSSRSVYAPHLVKPVQWQLFKLGEITMFTGFPRAWWPRWRLSEFNAARISVKISLFCEFGVTIGMITGLLGCCLSSTLWSRVNDEWLCQNPHYAWVLNAPFALLLLGCWTNNTLAARSVSLKSITTSHIISRWSVEMAWCISLKSSVMMDFNYLCRFRVEEWFEVHPSNLFADKYPEN